MKFSIFIVLSFFFLNPLLAFDPGQYDKKYCQNMVVAGRSPGFYSVREPQVFQGPTGRTYLQKVTYRGETFYAVTDILGTFQLKAPMKSVADFVVVEDHIWVLSGMDLIEFNGRGLELNRYNYLSSGSRHQKPTGLDLRGDELLIAHGEIGLVSFNLISRNFNFISRANTLQDDGKVSKAISVTWQGERAYVALTGNRQYAFNGVVVIDLKTNEVINAAEYRQSRYGVLDPQARIYSHKGEFYLNNGGWIHRFEEQELLTKEFPKPRWLPIPHQHNNRNMYLRIRGDFVIENDTIYGCALVERNATIAQRKL
jgi:hypothetical protein